MVLLFLFRWQVKAGGTTSHFVHEWAATGLGSGGDTPRTSG